MHELNELERNAVEMQILSSEEIQNYATSIIKLSNHTELETAEENLIDEKEEFDIEIEHQDLITEQSLIEDVKILEKDRRRIQFKMDESVDMVNEEYCIDMKQDGIISNLTSGKTEDYSTPTIKLLHKHAEVEAAENTLIKGREEFERKMAILEKRKQELVIKQTLLEENMKNFEKDHQKNQFKTNEAIRKLEEENIKQVRHRSSILKLRDEIHILEKDESKLNQQIQNYQVFRDFIRKVAENSDDCADANDVVHRYEMLMALLMELTGNIKTLEDEIMKKRTEIALYFEEKSNEILQYNVQLQELQTRVDYAQNETLKSESTWNDRKNTIVTKLQERARINMAVRNHFTMVQKFKKRDTYLDDIIKQLDKIKEFLVDWREVIDEMEKLGHVSSQKTLHSSRVS